MNYQLFNTLNIKYLCTKSLVVMVFLATASVYGQMTPPEVPPLTPEYSSTPAPSVPTLPEPAVPASAPTSTMPEPSIPTTPLPETTQTLPTLPNTPTVNTPNASNSSNNRPSPSAITNPNFQANFNKAFIGQPVASWPPTYGTAIQPAVTPPAPVMPNVSAEPMTPQATPMNGALSQNGSLPQAPNMPTAPTDTSSYSTTDNNINSLPVVNPDNTNTPVVPVEPQVPSQPTTDEVAVRTIHIPANANTSSVPQSPQPQLNPIPDQAQVTQQPIQPQVPQEQLPVQQPALQQVQQPVPPQPSVQQQIPLQTQQPPQQPVQPLAQKPAQQPPKSQYMFTGGSICALNIRAVKPGEHPMAPLVPWAKAGLEEFSGKIQDYTCVMTKRERINGKLTDTNSLFMKVREKPYSVYVYYLTPSSKKGVEALYRKGYHNDQLLGHEASGIKAMVGAVWLDPKGRMAMMGQKYPITDAGIPNLVKKMLETVTMDLKNDPQGKNTTVNFVENGGNIDGRPCIRVDVSHPKYNSCYRFHLAEIYLDKEWGVPVRYAAWLWPKEPGGKPLLDEEFTMTKIKFNVGLTDKDFSETNPDYNFQKKK